MFEKVFKSACVCPPQQQNPTKSLMFSRLVLLEHLNFKVPYETGEHLITQFFVNTLGCPESPPGRMQVCNDSSNPSLLPNGTDKQMHVNLGPLSQLHFEFATSLGEPYVTAQRLCGKVTLEVANLHQLKQSLNKIRHPFEDVGSGIEFHDPFCITKWFCVQTRDPIPTQQCFRPGGFGNVLRLDKVQFLCEPGLEKSIVNFYSQYFLAETKQEGKLFTRHGQEISWVGSVNAPPANAYDTNPQLDAIHMCFYVSKFEETARELFHRFWVNPDYVGPPINDHVTTVDEAIAKKQFRIKHIGDKYILEHEIRNVTHPRNPFGSTDPEPVDGSKL